MDRRWVGLLVIGAVLVAVPVVGRLLGPGEPGTAVAEPPPGTPAIGDCITGRESAVLPFWMRTVDTVVPPAEAAPCGGARFAEVVLVFPDPSEATRGYAIDPLVQQCSDAGLAYVGLPVVDLTGPPPVWSVSSAPIPLLAGPDARQAAAGQHWLACLAAPGWQVLEPPTVDEDAAYEGTLRDSIPSGTHRDLFGVCVLGDTLFGTSGPCSMPHDVEVLGYGFADVPLDDRQAVEDSCRAHLEVVTGLADVTAGGVLEPRVVAASPDGFPAGADEPIAVGSGMECQLVTTGTRLLRGSLLGLGDDPIPWS